MYLHQTTYTNKITHRQNFDEETDEKKQQERDRQILNQQEQPNNQNTTEVTQNIKNKWNTRDRK